MDASTASTVLGVAAGADKAEVKRAYRRLARLNHPDKGGNAQAFKRVKEAYELLIKTAPEPKPEPTIVDPVELRYQQIVREVEEQAQRIEQAAAEAQAKAEQAVKDAPSPSPAAEPDQDSFAALFHDLAVQAGDGVRRVVSGEVPIADTLHAASEALRERIAAGLSDLESASEAEPQTPAERELARVRGLIRRYTDQAAAEPYTFDVRG